MDATTPASPQAPDRKPNRNPDRNDGACKRASRAKAFEPGKKSAGRPYGTPPVDKACGKCEVDIRVYANQEREFNYCGRACYFAHKRESFGTNQCAGCKGPVGAGRRYCSRDCNINSRLINEAIVTLACKECGVEFPRVLRETRPEHRKSGQAYCSQRCGNQHAKRVAAKARTRPLGSTNASTQGYAVVKTEAGWEPEHRVVMECVIGRPLWPDENVHHRNGSKSDNRPENLELWSTSQPKGQRIEDKVAWAIEMIERYDPERLRKRRTKAA